MHLNFSKNTREYSLKQRSLKDAPNIEVAASHTPLTKIGVAVTFEDYYQKSASWIVPVTLSLEMC